MILFKMEAGCGKEAFLKGMNWEFLIWIIIGNTIRAYSRKSGHACDFSEKGQKKGEKHLQMLNKGKIFENLGKNVQNLKIF